MASTAHPSCKALILKVASRCNLNCTYCYMYNLGDNSYKNQPKLMNDATIDAIIDEVKQHCTKHNIPQFEFIFHGGEPLLASPVFYEIFVHKAIKKLSPQIKPIFNLQTNGVLLTEKWCEILGQLKISIGVSIDGPQKDNDSTRVDHQGKGSYERIIRGLKIAQNSKKLLYPPGILSVINVLSDPVQNYQHLKALNVQFVDFLLPDCTHQKLPPLKKIDNKPYADWLIKVFDLWYFDQHPKPTIRIFTQLIRLMIGYDEGFEYFGHQKNEFLVIETDGSIEITGAFKICGDSFTKKNLNINQNSIDEALKNDFYHQYYAGHQNLCQECQSCPIVEVCGGGFIAHRYSENNGFDNPSVYCLDLKYLIKHIQNVVYESLPSKLKKTLQLRPIKDRDLVRKIAI
ncbi:radical SAM protein [Emticicia aquatilis]|nr:radical SAM protein [Emticicia aquatilis]